MSINVGEVAVECTRRSDQGTITFPEVVRRLAEAGVERYHTDLVRAEKTYYTPEGATHVVPSSPLAVTPAIPFSPADIQAAISAIQENSIDYTEFCRQIAAAGCVGYHVSLVGRRAVYYGRTSELHVEYFPEPK